MRTTIVIANNWNVKSFWWIALNMVMLALSSTTEQVKRLYQEADFYLDINHKNEILSATRAA